MLQISIIVFREVLEIALIVSIVLAATKNVQGRNKYIFSGLSLGVLGALFFALIMDNIAALFQGGGQKMFEGVVLLVSAAMIAWTVLWMKQHSKQVSGELKQAGAEISAGEKSMMVLVPILAFAILREGAEIVIFSYGYFVSGENVLGLIFGALTGLICGAIAGVVFYFGLVRTLGKYFFSVTTWLLVFLAAGMAAGGVGYLGKAQILPQIINPIWDSSFLLDQKSVAGEILHALIGYREKPSLLQAITYFGVIGALVLGLKRVGLRK
jgi:high-affinity iron transporter